MVFRKQILNRNLFSLNHEKVHLLPASDYTLYLERDTSLNPKCQHAIKVICKHQLQDTHQLIEEFMLGFLPTDLSFNLATLMEENRNYFKFECQFTDP